MINKRATNFLRDPPPANTHHPARNQVVNSKFSNSLPNYPISKFQKLPTTLTSPLRTCQNSIPPHDKQGSHEFSPWPATGQPPSSNFTQVVNSTFSNSLPNHPISKFQKLPTTPTSPLPTCQNSSPRRDKQASYEFFRATPLRPDFWRGGASKKRKEAVSISKDWQCQTSSVWNNLSCSPSQPPLFSRMGRGRRK